MGISATAAHNVTNASGLLLLGFEAAVVKIQAPEA